MSAAQWTWLVTVSVSVLVGWLAVRYDNEKKAISYLMALVTCGIGASFALYLEVSSIRVEQAAVLARILPTLKNPIWNSVVQDIAEYDRQNSATPLEGTLYEHLRQVISRNINQAREGFIEIPDKNDAVAVTLGILTKAQESVRATSYIDPKEWWQSDIAPAYDENLRTTRQHVKSFQRLFIVGSAEEAAALKGIMEAQQKAGLDVKFICASSVAADRREDFIVVDGSVAAVLVLDDRRKFTNSRFFPTKIRAEDFDKRFTNLWLVGKPPADVGKLSCGSVH